MSTILRIREGGGGVRAKRQSGTRPIDWYRHRCARWMEKSSPPLHARNRSETVLVIELDHSISSSALFRRIRNFQTADYYYPLFSELDNNDDWGAFLYTLNRRDFFASALWTIINSLTFSVVNKPIN
jgi:hypothetical protein